MKDILGIVSETGVLDNPLIRTDFEPSPGTICDFVVGDKKDAGSSLYSDELTVKAAASPSIPDVSEKIYADTTLIQVQWDAPTLGQPTNTPKRSLQEQPQFKIYATPLIWRETGENMRNPWPWD